MTDAPEHNSAPDGTAEEPVRPTPALHGRISHVIGGKSEGTRKGTPPAFEMTIEGDDGVSTEIRPVAPDGWVEESAAFVAEIRAQTFPVCPICFEENPTSREHVPQESIGGQVMTRTCSRCNNTLGSRLERRFLDWYDDAASVRYSVDHHPEVQGPRFGGRVLFRRDQHGNNLLIPDPSRPQHPDVAKLFAVGTTVASDWRRPTFRLVQMTAAKHAYLAACLAIGGVPGCESADQIRDALLKVRDHPKSGYIPECEAVRRLLVGKTNLAPSGPTLALLERRSAAGEFLISLAGTVVVSWPFPDFPPTGGRRVVDLVEMPDPRDTSGWGSPYIPR